MTRLIHFSTLLAATLSYVELQAEDSGPGIQLVRTLPGHEAPVNQVLVSADGKWIYTREKAPSGVFKVWDAGTGQLHSRMDLPGFLPGSAALARNGELIAFGCGADIALRKFPSLDGIELLQSRSTSPNVPVTRLAFSSNDEALLSIHQDGKVSIWDMHTEETLRSWYPHGRGRRVHYVTTSLDGTQLATCGDDGVRVWETVSQTELYRVEHHGKAVVHAAFSPDGLHLATAGRDFHAAVWDNRTGKNLAWLKGHRQSVWRVHFLPNPDYLMTGSMDKTLRVWRWRETQQTAIRSCTNCVTMYSDLSSDGRIVASAGGEHPYADRVTDEKDYAVRLWQLPYETLVPQRKPLPSFPIAILRKEHLSRLRQTTTQTNEPKTETSMISWNPTSLITWNEDEMRLRIDRLFQSYEYSMKEGVWSTLPEHRHYLRVGSKKRVYLSYQSADTAKGNDQITVDFVSQIGDETVTHKLHFTKLVEIMKDWRDTGGRNYDGDVVRILGGLSFILSSNNRWLLVPIGGTGEYGDPSWHTFVFDTKTGVSKHFRGVFVPRNEDPFERQFGLFSGDPPDFFFRGVRWDSPIHDIAVIVTQQGDVRDNGEIYRNGYYRLASTPSKPGRRQTQLTSGGILQVADTHTGPQLFRYSRDFSEVDSLKHTPYSAGLSRYASIHSSPSCKWHLAVGASGVDYMLLNEAGETMGAWRSGINRMEGVVGPPKEVKSVTLP